MLIIGLTGGIGSGKSTVASLFADYNVPILDADLIARELVEPGQPAFHRIIDTFGEHVLSPDGRLDRHLLRKQIFDFPAMRLKLEAILHPLIRQTMQDRLENIDADYVILVIPLLVESGWNIADRILVVNIPADIQMQRVTQRDQIPEQQAQQIINSQICAKDRLAAADDIIDNSGNLEVLKEQVSTLHAQYIRPVTREINIDTHARILSPAASTQLKQCIYEQPLNERIRTFLRLEHLFNRAEYHLGNNTEHDSHGFICALTDISNLAIRGDLKSEIIKELERQHASLKRHQNIPGVNQSKLSELLDQQSNLLDGLHACQNNLGQHLKSDLLFSNIRQRLGIPGGTCDFDLPIYYYWSNHPNANNVETLQNWLKPFLPLSKAIASCLKTIRNSADPTERNADNGYYEQTLDTSSEIQLIRAVVNNDQKCYPTISAGKHRLNVRFMEWYPGQARAQQTTENIPFELMICGL